MTSGPIHLNTLIHNIILLLKRTDDGITFERLKSLLQIDILSSPELLSRLKTNPRIIFSDVRLQYRPKYNIKNAEELIDRLSKHPSDSGIPLSELKESYKNIESDLQSNYKLSSNVILVTAGEHSFIFGNSLPDTKAAPEDIKALWRKLSPGGMSLTDK